MRYRVLLFGVVAVLLVCGGCAAGVAWIWSRSTLSTAGEIDFVNRLPVPPLAPSRVDSQGRRVFQLTAALGRHDFGTGGGADLGIQRRLPGTHSARHPG